MVRPEEDACGEPGRDTGSAGVLTAPADATSWIGRYQLIEKVGVGSTGAVWSAWDPELARQVAIKVVHPGSSAARNRALAQGQMLGRISHPNIIAIYDVGTSGDQIYLVMERFYGTTLREYAARPRSRRELIDGYRQAGEGLAAAHRAGVIHRNFSPDSAIRGDDGRVRVLDFGLAHDQADSLGRSAVGMRYLAPEQIAGRKVTAAADQYAFAISLSEAMATISNPVSGRPVELPSWLARVVAGGAAADPAHRFASMDELLHALARSDARKWRRRAIAAVAVSAAAVAFAAGRTPSKVEPTCGGSVSEISRSWNPTTRAAVVGQLRSLGAFGSGEADRLGDELDRYSAEWADEHRRACLAREAGLLSPALHERRVVCLARGRAALGTIAELMATASETDLAQALVAAHSLPSPRSCVTNELSGALPPPATLADQVAAAAPLVERARVLALAARAEAVDAAHQSVIAAERIGYAPLIARALIAQGIAAFTLRSGEDAARVPLEHAVDLALRSGDDALAVEGYARLVYAVGLSHGDVVDNWPAMEAIAERIGAAGRFSRALLYNNKAVARMVAKDHAGAHALLRRAVATLPQRLGPEELELLTVYHNLAMTTDDPDERERRLAQAVEQRTAALGANHPSTIRTRVTAGMLVRNPAAAAAALDAACDAYRRWHPHLAADGAQCAFVRAWLADDQGDSVRALEAMREAAVDPMSPHQRLLGAIAAGYVKIAAGDDIEGAIRSLQDVAVEQAREAGSWPRGEAADAYTAAARGWDALHRSRDAERCWVAALDLLEGIHDPFVDRRLARVRGVLARRWAQIRPTEARRLAAAAAAWYRGAGGYDAEVAALDAIVQEAGARSSPR
jgi:serine/threonine protein kinase/tetratricopeptide (TPR) repeat protein